MLLQQILAVAVLLGVCFALFGALGRLAPCNPGQPVFFSRSIGLDFAYGVLGVTYAWVGPALAGLLVAAGVQQWAPLARPLSAIPLWAQLALLLVVTDFGQYWLHRAFHIGVLWPYHAIHHAAREVNWTTTFRTHPVNALALNTVLALAARVVGFSELSLLVAGPIFFFSGVFTHANLNVSFGPLRYVIASPVFHRWHHSLAPEARETNFAPMFPLWDLLFGTFRMPVRQRPEHYGAEGVPEGLVGQLVHPFAHSAARAEPAPP